MKTSLHFFTFLLFVMSYSVSAQVDEIIITAPAYIAPLSYDKWEVSGGGLGAAAAGAAYSSYRNNIAMQNACLDKKNAQKAASDQRESCIKQAPVIEALANKSCSTVTEATVTVGGGFDIRAVTFNVGGTLKWNPQATCRLINHDDEVIAVGKCETDYTNKLNQLDFQYRTLKCS